MRHKEEHMKVTGKYYLFNRAIGYYSFFMFLVFTHLGIYFESQSLGEGEKYTSFYNDDIGVSGKHSEPRRR